MQKMNINSAKSEPCSVSDVTKSPLTLLAHASRNRLRPLSIYAFCGSLAFLAACNSGGGGDAEEPPPVSQAPLKIQHCEALADLKIDASDIGLPTQGAIVQSATIEPEVLPYPDSEGEHLLTTPSSCLVLGSIASIDPEAPPIQFAVNLPLENWNRRLLQSGGGGLGGTVNTAPGRKASGRFDPNPVNVAYPITQGYVTFGSDGGHTSSEYSYTRNEEAVRNWAHEHLKKTKDVAMIIAEQAYEHAPEVVYFSGESAGGREALMMAQRYPNDYDGIIATSPVLSWNYSMLAYNAIRDRFIDGGFLEAEDIKLIADQTRKSCDAEDGLVDGVIAKYMRCANDVAVLRCTDGQAGTGCLSDEQIAAVNAIREPYQAPFAMAHGVPRFPGFFATGDEDGDGYQWSFYPVGTVAPSNPLPEGRGNEAGRGGLINFATFWVRHLIVQDDSFDPYQFNPGPYAARIQELSHLFDATDPDLSVFAKRGGKIIIVHPSADNATPLSVTADYYRNVVKSIGRQATDAMMRLYVGPGGSHNVGGVTQINALELLEKWTIDQQTPPDAPIAYDLDTTNGNFIRSMPACRYPAYPHYNGNGDETLSTSFTCIADSDPLDL